MPERGSTAVHTDHDGSTGPPPGVLTFEKVTREYPRPGGAEAVRVLGGITFGAAANRFTAIVGPSGCGKSTLLQMATGLDAPTDGTVRYRDTAVTGVGDEIGYITQQANLFPWMTLAKNVELPLIVREVPQAERRELLTKYLELAGLTGFEDHYPHQLSGGMQKRASIIRTLIYSPPLVLLDEPFGSLDAQTRMQMHGDLLRLWEEQEATVVFVTHDLQEAVTLADHVVLLSRQPTTVKAEVPIRLDRPRDVFEPYAMSGFVETYDQVWGLFRSEVIRDDRG